MIISFALSYKSEESKLLQFDPDTFQSVMISMLRALNDLAGRDDSPTNTFKQMYENCCLVVLCRSMQNSRLRPFCIAMLLKFPSVPMSCLKLLKLLMVTGSKTTQPDESAKSKSIRTESLNTLIGLINQAPDGLSFSSLNIVLWSTLSEEFEVRSRVIASLTRLVLVLLSSSLINHHTHLLLLLLVVVMSSVLIAPR